MPMEFPHIFPVTSHTDFVGPGSTFIAIQGMKADGVSYIPHAIERGATTIVIQDSVTLPRELEQLLEEKKITLVRVPQPRRALATFSARAFNFPAQKLKIIGITGTKGKTTTAFLIEHILASAGYKTALLSTVYNKILQHQLPTTLTTQHPDYLHLFFDQCLKARVEYVVMEVAAQAFNLDRVYGIEFDAFIFTNFDQEHAEFYPTLDSYFQAKCALLKQTKPQVPMLINTDNQWCATIAHAYPTAHTFGMHNTQYAFTIARATSHATNLILTNSTDQTIIATSLIGTYNAYNITGAFALCHSLGIATQSIASALATFDHVPGRLEHHILPNGALGIIDYAHNPSSYQSVLSTLRTLTDHLLIVCGAGGDRDKTKRPLMGALATQYADHVIFTSDNPRTENPATIIQEIISGVLPEHQHKFECELDREKAIIKAYHHSKKGSIIALLGKGPDHYQIINDTKFYFNETEILTNIA